MSRLSFACVLIESCNLRCDHCFQNHVLNNIPTLDSLNELKTILKGTIEEDSKCKELTQVDLSFLGGEILQDIIPDEVIEGYKNLILNIKNLVPKLDFKVDFVSNGIFKKHERIINKRGCFLCEHFNSCPMYCWMAVNHKDYQMSECPHKRIFEYIKNNIDSICGEKNV